MTCARCGCVCDDLTIEAASDRIVSVSPGCSMADEWFQSLRLPSVASEQEISGRQADLPSAIQKAADLLKHAQAPLIWGLSRSSTEGQRAACELADLLGGTIDTTASVGHGPSIMAVQSCGESTSTLGEVRNRSDLVIFWASDPVTTHPRHLERFVEAAGLRTPRGRLDRKLIVVDSRRTETSAVADEFLQIEEHRDFEVLWALRALVQGHNLAGPIGGVPISRLQQLADTMSNCRYGAVFFGIRLAQQPVGHASVEALLRLVTDLHAKTRFVVRRMRVSGDVTGADSVLCWQTGFPYSVSLSRGYPRYNPDEYTAERLLSRQETDCVLLVGAERVQKLSAAAQAALKRIPVIILDPPNAEYGVRSDVRFNTAIYGVHRAGTSYRMDEVPIPLRKLIDSSLPSDDEVLRGILQQLREKDRNGPCR